MVFRKSKPAEPLPPWRSRFDDSRTTVLAHVDRPEVRERLDRIEHDLSAAQRDLDRIADALVGLDPERTSRELKAALRAQGLAPDSPEVRRLRARHETVHDLRNRHDDLARAIESTLADLEIFAVRTVSARLDTVQPALLERELADLHDDLTALDAARDEVSRIERQAGLHA